ncbi:hypothetical protein PISMIDRAFT_276074 [Pisolithus microcarpus 441]|uniref:Uncharacterized protein n=1 Tax=Pisolithus microcarpus 441 TaxID=765257 RepID=A0A0C9YHL2_9AGAM|nr:hypothetical protein BKA83DRAFT_276074 [Pisolithus microcarpus]KIK16171.1 hypothetical protein PISMIDRAFT_276074 [Pisolithus microcarpus 441]
MSTTIPILGCIVIKSRSGTPLALSRFPLLPGGPVLACRPKTLPVRAVPWTEWTVNWGLGHLHMDNLRSPISVDLLVQGKLVTVQKMVQLRQARQPHCRPSTSQYRVGHRYRRRHPNQVIRMSHVCVSTSRLRVAVTPHITTTPCSDQWALPTTHTIHAEGRPTGQKCPCVIRYSPGHRPIFNQDCTDWIERQTLSGAWQQLYCRQRPISSSISYSGCA